MSYITTFDTLFWISFALAAVLEFSKPYILGPLTLYFVKHPKQCIPAAVAVAIVSIASMIGCFYWSPAGTTTAMFWSCVLVLIFYMPYLRRQAKIQERVYDYLAEHAA